MSTHYLKDSKLLAEIAKSKASYCWFANPDFAAPTGHITTLYGPFQPGMSPFVEGAILRYYTYEHIAASDLKNRARDPAAKGKHPVNFPPFKHLLVRDGELVEVGRSHWRGDLETGHFSPDHGRITNDLATALMMISDRYSRRSNWGGYTYRDEMAADALVHLVRVALRFNEGKGNNPFSFYTTTTYNEFLRTQRAEKAQQGIRDDLLFIAGRLPSITRQIEMENPTYKHGPVRGPGKPKSRADGKIAA